MRREIEYRLFFNNEPATREQLDRVDSISVEQEVDAAWEARLEIPICLDAQGRWAESNEPFMRPSARVRVEVSVVRNQFVPLIDGLIVGLDSRMQFEPGQSMATLIARDDSVYLHRHDEHFNFDDETDHEIVSEIFDSIEQIATSNIDRDLADAGEEAPAFRGNGTAMQILRDLARIHDKHVYVLPGESPGESIGNFKAFPDSSDRQTNGLPPMILLGAEANIREFNGRRDITGPEEVFSSSIRISDKEVTSARASFRDRELLGETPALPEGTEAARRILRPNPFVGRQREANVAARAQRSSYAFEATGSVIEGCYQGVLQPYRLVTVRAGKTPLSGTHVITRVTHNLGRSTYSQSFTLARNAASETSRESLASLTRSIF